MVETFLKNRQKPIYFFSMIRDARSGSEVPDAFLIAREVQVK